MYANLVLNHCIARLVDAMNIHIKMLYVQLYLEIVVFHGDIIRQKDASKMFDDLFQIDN